MADSLRRYARTQVARASHDEFVMSTHLHLFIWISAADAPPLAPHLCADERGTSHVWLIANHSAVTRPCPLAPDCLFLRLRTAKSSPQCAEVEN